MLGIRYRTEPYDFNNAGDFAEAVIMATAEYADYLCCASRIAAIADSLDASIEVFEPAEREKLLLGKPAREDIAAAVSHLEGAVTALWQMVERSERQYRMIWRLALACAPDEVLEKVCGEAFRAAPEEIDRLLEFTFEHSGARIEDIYRVNVETTARAFGQALKKELDAMRKSSLGTG